MGMEKYDLDTKKAVGRGAFGAVYLYQRKSDHKEIIIKQITIDDLTTDQRKGVMNEIEVTAMFNHPNIIKYHEYFVEDKTFNIVMDYEPGGNLFDYLQQRHDQSMMLEEEEILKFFGQIARAMHHIHSHNILHRDMKTHNILLDRRKRVAKICDFGISKFLTKTNAMTTVGTAHYMSPEVVEGKLYNKTSDIWSLGCILYELIALKRAFDADSLSSILRKILRCEYSKMPDFYSEELKMLVKSILKLDPAKRPAITHILAAPILINSLLDLETDVGRIPCLYGYGSNQNKKSSVNSSVIHKTTSFTSWGDETSRQLAEQTSIVYGWGGGVKLPAVLQAPGTDQFISQVCIGRTKKLGLTSNGRVFTWENSFSTTKSSILEDKDSSTSSAVLTPKIIGEFSGSTIAQVCCGDQFVAVKTDRGMLMTWGSGVQGCLGHGTTSDSPKAKVVEDLVGCTVVQLSCGAAHVMALTNDNQLFVWGKGSSGNLGLNDKQQRLKPTLVPLPSKIRSTSIICGTNCSFLITSEGTVYTCGNNRDNKLAVLNEDELSRKPTNEDYLIFTKLTCKPLAQEKIINISAGSVHTAFLTVTGRLYTAGNNKNNQLGYQRDNGDYRPAMVESMSQKGVKHVGCGDTYTIIVTSDNEVYGWGSGKHGRLGLGHIEDARVPTQLQLDGAKLNFHSLSVCHSSTLIVGQVKNPT
ncbi:serine/threonine-protein kinase Nek8-like isoform X2 [Hydractinia symbiolongicarpus]|uniref:serine/threonine-protein kinase Nek8-like isoform X2 n=1 Tax=Hydractinia symbiolongicarpus TaxID=13093 RepID=UPI00254C6516|nr:serine/threonine-protein kinase Nek8-like isoform X2 [Hydractinia symbiolongicarpus]